MSEARNTRAQVPRAADRVPARLKGAPAEKPAKGPPAPVAAKAAALKRAASREAPLVLMLSAAHPPTDLRVVGKEGAALAAAGWRVTHLAPAPVRGAKDVPASHAGVAIATYPRASGWFGRMRAARALAKRAAKFRPDVIHAHEPDSWYAAVLAAGRTGAAVVLDVHEHYPSRLDGRLPGMFRGLGRRAVEAACRWLAARADAVVVAKDGLEEAFPGVEVVPVRNYAAAVPVVPRAHRPGPVTLVHLGALTRERGAFEMLRALAHCPEGTRLSLVGRFTDGSETGFLAEARRLGVADAVERHGWVTHAAALALAAEADIGLVLFQPGHENHRLALPHKLFDCMMAGIPVIVPDFAEEVAAVVRETGCGVLVDTADPDTIAEAVRALSDPDLRAEMGAAGRAAALGRYGWAGEAERLVGLYQDLAPLPLADRVREVEAPPVAPSAPAPAPPPVARALVRAAPVPAAPLPAAAPPVAAPPVAAPPVAPAPVAPPPVAPPPVAAPAAPPAPARMAPAVPAPAAPVAAPRPEPVVAAPRSEPVVAAPRPGPVAAAPLAPAAPSPTPAPAAPPARPAGDPADAFASLSAAMRAAAPLPAASRAAVTAPARPLPEAAPDTLAGLLARPPAPIPAAPIPAAPASPAAEPAPRLLLDAALSEAQAVPAALSALLARPAAEAPPGPPLPAAPPGERPPPSQVLGPVPAMPPAPAPVPAASPSAALGSVVQALRGGGPAMPRPAPAEPGFSLLAQAREAMGASLPPSPPAPPRPAPRPVPAAPALTGRAIEAVPEGAGVRLLAGLSGGQGVPAPVAALLARGEPAVPAAPPVPAFTSDVPLLQAGLRAAAPAEPAEARPEWRLLLGAGAPVPPGPKPPAPPVQGR